MGGFEPSDLHPLGMPLNVTGFVIYRSRLKTKSVERYRPQCVLGRFTRCCRHRQNLVRLLLCRRSAPDTIESNQRHVAGLGRQLGQIHHELSRTVQSCFAVRAVVGNFVGVVRLPLRVHRSLGVGQRNWNERPQLIDIELADVVH